jgi:hypothetical protein
MQLLKAIEGYVIAAQAVGYSKSAPYHRDFQNII